MSRKRILIIDDHPLFREGLKSIFERNTRFKVAGEAGRGDEGVQLAKKLQPDLVLLDLSLPDKSGIQMTREILAVLPNTKVLIISMHSKINYITEAFQAGASGYLVKESASERLLDALEMVSKGEYFLDSSISREVVKKLINSPKKEVRITGSPYEALTPREQEIMRLLAEGLSSKAIADKLFISPKTVENHRSNIMNKLEIHTIFDLVRYAAKIGLIDVDLWK